MPRFAAGGCCRRRCSFYDLLRGHAARHGTGVPVRLAYQRRRSITSAPSARPLSCRSRAIVCWFCRAQATLPSRRRSRACCGSKWRLPMRSRACSPCRTCSKPPAVSARPSARSTAGMRGPLKEFGVDFNMSLTLGGQIRGEGTPLVQHLFRGQLHRGDRRDTYFQIGESKYGKPILDRVIRRSSSLNEAAKCALVSMGLHHPLEPVGRACRSISCSSSAIVTRSRATSASMPTTSIFAVSVPAERSSARGLRGAADPDWLRTPTA